MPTVSKKIPVILAVDNVRSLHNLGAFFRTADGAGIEKIILSKLCATPPRTEISKTALGAELTVPWKQPADFLASLLKLKNEGYTIYALEQTPRATDLFSTKIQFPAVLVVGHEREGVSQEILDLCDEHVEIPMHGSSAHSLNVSVATGVALYEMNRSLRTIIS